jgi:N utilization substance protein B
MISRRNIRVKVMQTLYSLESYNNPSGDNGTPGDILPVAKRLLQQHLDQTTRLFIYLLYNIIEVTRYAETDARQRAAKHLPTAADLHVNTQITANSGIRRLIGNPDFIKTTGSENIQYLTDPEIIKKIYQQLVASPEYLEYIAQPDRDEKEDKQILLYIFHELLMKSEAFDQHAEDIFLHWPDDREMMDILVGNYIGKPQSFDFSSLISPEKKTYSFELLQTALEKRPHCLELIRPRLQNWDPDRIASIDMLLMDMAICEFLYFPTIPTKVTINEYIDLAKTYSTPQSGQFVNGILDNVLKDLSEEQKIHKTDRIRK